MQLCYSIITLFSFFFMLSCILYIMGCGFFDSYLKIIKTLRDQVPRKYD